MDSLPPELKRRISSYLVHNVIVTTPRLKKGDEFRAVVGGWERPYPLGPVNYNCRYTSNVTEGLVRIGFLNYWDKEEVFKQVIIVVTREGKEVVRVRPVCLDLDFGFLRDVV